MFIRTSISLNIFKDADIELQEILDKHKQQLDKLKEDRLKAKLQLKEAIHKWRVKNFLYREQKVRQTSNTLYKGKKAK